jgi:hypothetical protein
MGPEIPGELAAVGALLGRWAGEGIATYPTMNGPVPYREELEFDHVGDPFLRYAQQSWTLEGAPLHFERGFLRVAGHDVEACLAHPLGLAEVAHGRVEGAGLELSSEGAVTRSATGAAVTGLRRRYRWTEDRLAYEVEMAMDEVPMTVHLEAELRRA